MSGLRERIQAKNAKKKQAKSVYSSNTVGSVALWYGAGGKVVFQGNITFGDYKDSDCVKYQLILFEADESKKYIYSGIVTLPYDGDKKKRQPKVGNVFMYESNKQAAYMMVYLDTDVEGESEVFVSPLIENNSDNPKSSALYGRVYEADNKDEQANDKSRVKKAEEVLKTNRKQKADDWYTDLEPKDLMTIIKSYDEEKLDSFIALFENHLSSFVSIVEEQKVDHGYEVVDEDEEEYEEIEVEDEEEEEEEVEIEELPQETSNKKLRIRDIANKGTPSKALGKRVSSTFFSGLADAAVEDLM